LDPLTGLGVSDVALWEASEVQVKALVNVANVLLEVGFDLGELEWWVSNETDSGNDVLIIGGSPYLPHDREFATTPPISWILQYLRRD
jgi:hypothetical protein